MSISGQKKALIHIAKQQLGMVDEDYRAILQRVAAVTSSADLDDASFETVMSEFERLGFRSTRGRAQKGKREGMATPAQVGKIRSLWHGWLGRDDEPALGRWMEKHFHISHVRFLEAHRAGKVIAVLTKMQQHPNAKHPVGKPRATNQSNSTAGEQQ